MMSHLVSPAMELQCHYCDYRPAKDAPMEVFVLHVNTEHDTDAYKLDLRAICSCGAAMTFDGKTEQRGNMAVDFFTCDACGNTAEVHRSEGASPDA